MKPARYIVDTTMRDGEQSPGIAMNMEQKLQVARLLDEAGIHQIEAGIPAMSDYEIETIRGIVAQRKRARISVWNRIVIEDIKKSMLCRPDIIHISTPVSYVLIYSKLNKNKGWVVKNLLACVEFAVSNGYEVTVGFEDASRADITFMTSLACQLKERGVTRVRFADTVGVLTPTRALRSVREIVDYTGLDVEMHAHNDLGMAVANTVLGARGGALYLDTTIRGIGERAGNCDFTKLIQAAGTIFDFRLSLSEARRLEEKVAQILSIAEAR